MWRRRETDECKGAHCFRCNPSAPVCCTPAHLSVAVLSPLDPQRPLVPIPVLSAEPVERRQDKIVVKRKILEQGKGCQCQI